jgi:hypothetical protein
MFFEASFSISSLRYEIGGACNPNGREEKCIYDIGGKARRKKKTTGKTKT